MLALSVREDFVAAAVRPEVEACIRGLLADHLGVDTEQITPEVSLVDDLAADSLDLVEIALAIEGNLGLTLPHQFLDRVRTYGDLVQTTGHLLRTRCEAEADGAAAPLRISARITPPAGGSAGTLERTGWLSPYFAETVGDDAMRAGNGARLDVTLSVSSTADLARARRQFAGLGKRGVHVAVRRNDPPSEPFVESTG